MTLDPWPDVDTRKLVLTMRSRGVTAKVLSEATGLSEGRIYRITDKTVRREMHDETRLIWNYAVKADRMPTALILDCLR